MKSVMNKQTAIKFIAISLMIPSFILCGQPLCSSQEEPNLREAFKQIQKEIRHSKEFPSASQEQKEQLTDRLREFAKSLSKKERIILQKRLLSEIPKTLEELGDEFGVTKERVRQLQNRLIEKFREELKEFAEDYMSD